jgi:hypothetical protein
VQWDVRGDANVNATGTLEFREAGAAADWRPAFPLRRSAYRPALAAGKGAGRKAGGAFAKYAQSVFEICVSHCPGLLGAGGGTFYLSCGPKAR